MQYNKECKRCKQDCIYIGSAQNGYMWLCKKCNYIDYAPNLNNIKQFVYLIYFIYLCYIINIKTNNMKLTFEDNSSLIDVETTLKMLLQHAELKPHHKGWVIESYKNIVNFRYQNK